MTLVDTLLAMQETKGPSCGVGSFLAALPDGLDQAEVTAVVMNQAIRYTTLVKWSRDLGLTIRSDSWARHRKGLCACDRAR